MADHSIRAPSLEELLCRMRGAVEALDIMGLGLAENKPSGYDHIGRALLFVAETLADNLAAVQGALTEANKTHNVLDVGCPLRYRERDSE